MIRRDFFPRSIFEILQARSHLSQVDIAKTPIEEHLTREEPKLKSQLFIIDGRISSQIKQSVVKVGQGFLEIAQQEIRNAFLEIGNGEVLV